MFAWLQKDIPVGATLLFKGAWPLAKERFLGLRERGFEVTEREVPANGQWALKLRHSEWGEAVLLCLRDLGLPPENVVDWDVYLSDAEKAEVKGCQNALSLNVFSRRNHLLKDRKNAFFFMDALLGEDEIGAYDQLSGRIWSREGLRKEIARTGDADVQSLFSIHYVLGVAPKPAGADELEEAPKTGWLHTHGLADIGSYDFDILNPSPSVTNAKLDAVRSVAFALLEGYLKPGGTAKLFSTAGPIWAVPAKEFMAKAAPEWRAIRSDPKGEHVDGRVVLCEVAVNRFFGRVPVQVRPSKSLHEEFPAGCVVHFSRGAVELMGERG
jgi:hypothetical protein